MGQGNGGLVSLRRYPSVESRAISCFRLIREEGPVDGGQCIICSCPWLTLSVILIPLESGGGVEPKSEAMGTWEIGGMDGWNRGWKPQLA